MTRPQRVELYVRSLAPTAARAQQEQVVERLQALEAAGCLDDFEVVLCGGCVCPQSALAGTEPGERLLDRYAAFESWADDRGRDLVGFETRDTESTLTGTTVTGIVFPRVVLAEYRDDSLAFVAPSRDGDEKTTVTDRLDHY